MQFSITMDHEHVCWALLQWLHATLIIIRTDVSDSKRPLRMAEGHADGADRRVLAIVCAAQCKQKGSSWGGGTRQGGPAEPEGAPNCAVTFESVANWSHSNTCLHPYKNNRGPGSRLQIAAATSWVEPTGQTHPRGSTLGFKEALLKFNRHGNHSAQSHDVRPKAAVS